MSLIHHIEDMATLAKKRTARAGRYVALGFITGLGQMVSIHGTADARPFPGTRRSEAEALRGDWIKLGGDMRSAVRTVTGRGER